MSLPRRAVFRLVQRPQRRASALPRTVLRDHQATCSGPTLGAVRTRAGQGRQPNPRPAAQAAFELGVETSLLEADRYYANWTPSSRRAASWAHPPKVPLDGTANP